ncbi:hypothetical protein Rctr85_051 [Virus Rctr85]|nr:hypothetical protein Rctr85_051 [Virus Rctr85]
MVDLVPVDKLFDAEYGRGMNLYEENIARKWMQRSASDDPNVAMNALRLYTAQRAAVEIGAFPYIVYVRPVVATLVASVPTRKAIRPAVLYGDDEGREAAYFIGMQPTFLRTNHYTRDEHGDVFSHGPQVGWTTVKDPQFAWAWPMGACWISSIYSPAQFDRLYEYDRDNQPTVFGAISCAEVQREQPVP